MVLGSGEEDENVESLRTDRQQQTTGDGKSSCELKRIDGTVQPANLQFSCSLSTLRDFSVIPSLGECFLISSRSH